MSIGSRLATASSRWASVRRMPSTSSPSSLLFRPTTTISTTTTLTSAAAARRVPASSHRCLFSTSNSSNSSESTSSTDTANNTTTNSNNNADASKADAPPATPDHAAQLAEKDAKIKELNDKWMRALAEIENTRTRARNDVDNARKFAVQSFAKHMLEVADTLTLAGKSAEEALTKTQDPLFKSLHEGIVMTEKVLQKAFEANGVKRFDPLGQKFDPNFHDGLFEIDDPSKEPLTVAQVLKVGYTLNERILRAANVGTVRARSS